MRRITVGFLALVILIGLGVGVYARFFRTTALVETPRFDDTGNRLPTPDEFEALAGTDPVKLLEVCLTRYQREVKGGITATLVKRERVYGDPRPPKDPPEELIRLAVRKDVPAGDEKPRPQIRMVWESGARKTLLGTVTGTLFVEEQGGGQDRIAALTALGITMTPVSGSMAKGASRYCMCDAGLYRAMLRSHTVWKKRQEDGALHWRLAGKRAIEPAGGRICYVVERTCMSPEVDPFEIGGEPNIRSQDNPADVGQVRITLFIDAERWLQVGSELHRQDGHLLAAYYFRDINLNPSFDDDTFTPDGLKKAAAAIKK